METTIKLVGIIFTLPFLVLETGIKIIMSVLYFPLILGIAIIYPLIKRKNLNWVKIWWKYANKYKGGFISAHIYTMWEIED